MRLLKRLTAVIAILVVAEGALVTAIVMDSGTERTVREAGTKMVNTWFGDDETDGILSTYGASASKVFDRWVQPLWAAPRPDTFDEAFSDCLACHSTYAEQGRSETVYFAHPVHAEQEIDCGACHTGTLHPDPPTPAMQTCETCHMQVSTPGECQFCHAPGALPHWERMGVPSDDLETCNTCHLPGSLERPDDEPFMTHPTFDGSDPESCTDCHSTDWCAACHQLDHPNGWMFEHGPIVYDDGAGECVTCHSPSGCSFCHGEGAGFKAPLPADDLSG